MLPESTPIYHEKQVIMKKQCYLIQFNLKIFVNIYIHI